MGSATADGDILHYYHIVPVGSIVAWAKSFTGVPSLGEAWKECDGSVISDAESPLNGQTLPDLRGTGGNDYLLLGRSTSGSTGSGGTHAHTLGGAGGSTGDSPGYAYYTVVWIMRIK